jgi:hypothetical protein
VSQGWAVCIPIDRADSIGPLRRAPGVEACELGQSVWLRGSRRDEALEKAILALPGRRFQVLSDGQLTPAGALVPHGRLPDGPWMPVSQWLSIDVEPAAFAARVEEKVALRLVRGGPPQESNVLLTSADAWSRYAVAAPQVRLDRWAFAMDDRGNVLVRGTPLPPLGGVRFVERNGVAAPAGWTWRPAIDASVLQKVLRLADGDLALFHTDGSWDRLAADGFVRATRSAVRLSMRRTA